MYYKRKNLQSIIDRCPSFRRSIFRGFTVCIQPHLSPTTPLLQYPIPFLQNGQTPLHLAAMAGHPWVMEVFLLCDIGGVDDQDHDGNTCLHIASEMNWGEVVISLLERGANETLENKVSLFSPSLFPLLSLLTPEQSSKRACPGSSVG